jgi:hypothetical protein
MMCTASNIDGRKEMFRVQVTRNYGADEDFDFETEAQARSFAIAELQDADTRSADVCSLDDRGCEDRVLECFGR